MNDQRSDPTEIEQPRPGDPDHPTSSHLLQAEYRAHKQFDIDVRIAWAEANRGTWDA